MSDMGLKVFSYSENSVKWGAHIMGDCGSEHLEEVILEFELLIFNNMGDAPCHDHLVRPVLKQYLLLFEC